MSATVIRFPVERRFAEKRIEEAAAVPEEFAGLSAPRPWRFDDMETGTFRSKGERRRDRKAERKERTLARKASRKEKFGV